MNFFKFIFSFLYVRNWHTGKMELSRPRLSIFFAILFLVLLALTMILFLQSPVVYVAS
ncbi:MAG: hypothetical protein KBC62_02040 [Candidatus Pacebacteria bacterium]|nr:hypothetical protein [Candidatus Paceibacterota bacterium]